MIDDIKLKYDTFSDSWISKIKEFEDTIILTIVCSNNQNDYKYEKIELIFSNIVSFVLDENLSLNNIGIKDALFDFKNDLVIFDLDPIDHFDYLEENKNSKFKVVSRNIDLSFVEYYEN